MIPTILPNKTKALGRPRRADDNPGWAYFAERRRICGRSQAEIASLCGVSQAAVTKWERGKTMPDPLYWLALANALDVKTSELTSQIHAFFSQKKQLRGLTGTT